LYNNHSHNHRRYEGLSSINIENTKLKYNQTIVTWKRATSKPL
jgi:hypothetical protein